jgi:hypothetical protein
MQEFEVPHGRAQAIAPGEEHLFENDKYMSQICLMLYVEAGCGGVKLQQGLPVEFSKMVDNHVRVG